MLYQYEDISTQKFYTRKFFNAKIIQFMVSGGEMFSKILCIPDCLEFNINFCSLIHACMFLRVSMLPIMHECHFVPVVQVLFLVVF